MSKTYRSAVVLADVSFTLARGESLVVRGANGSGKTTLLSICAGLVDASSGALELEGRAMHSRAHGLRAAVGFSPASESSLFLNASVRENLEFWAKLQGLKKIDLVRLAEHWNFKPQLEQRARELSSGYRRRVALARAFLHKPRLILLDEPFAFLDKESHDLVLTNIEEWLKREAGVLVLSSNVEFSGSDRWKSLDLKASSNRDLSS